ncbi:MAG: FtsX-like permease family protein [Blautia sp.]
MSLIGLFLASLLAIIGLSNMVNTITSDVFSRKIELATLQSIGMTKSQLWKMLFGNVFRLSMISMAIIFPVGSALAYFLANHPIFTGFRPSVYLVSTGALLVVILGLCVALTSILVRVLNQKSIVERLREIE